MSGNFTDSLLLEQCIYDFYFSLHYVQFMYFSILLLLPHQFFRNCELRWSYFLINWSHRNIKYICTYNMQWQSVSVSITGTGKTVHTYCMEKKHFIMWNKTLFHLARRCNCYLFIVIKMCAVEMVNTQIAVWHFTYNSNAFSRWHVHVSVTTTVPYAIISEIIIGCDHGGDWTCWWSLTLWLICIQWDYALNDNHKIIGQSH